MQTIVLKVSLTFDSRALVEWAKQQKGKCCDYPAHDPDHLDWMEPELVAQSILGHAFLSVVPDEITDGGSVETLETGIPDEIMQRINVGGLQLAQHELGAEESRRQSRPDDIT